MARYVLVAGVNGAGKSTLYYLLHDIQNLPRVNMDEIVRSFGDWRNPSDVMRADKMAVQQIKNHLDSGISFNQETTLCGNSVLRNIKTAKIRGYQIEVHYIGLETVELAKERVHQRMLAGGHGIPDEDIDRRYKESLLHMQQILSDCNRVIFYDNTKQFRRFAVFENGIEVRVSAELPNWFKKYFD